MSITVENTFTNYAARPIEGNGSDKVVVGYHRTTSNSYVKIVTLSTSSVGSSYTVAGTDQYCWDIDRLSDTYCILLNISSNLVTARLLDISGSTPSLADSASLTTSGSEGGLVSFGLSPADDTTAFACYHNITPSEGRVAELTRSGATISHTNYAITPAWPCDVAALSSTKFMVSHLDGSNYPQVTIGDISSGLSEGSAATLESVAVGDVRLEALSSSLVIAAYSEGTNLKLCAISVSGTTATPGTVLTLYTGGVAYARKLLAKVDGTNFVVSCNNELTPCSVSGGTITDGTAGATTNEGGAYVMSDGTYLVAFLDGSSYVYLEEVSLGAAGKFYQGTNTLSYKVDLDFAGVNYDGLAVDSAAGVYVGSNTASAALLEKAAAADDYATWTDLTGTMSGSVKSVKRIE